MHRNSLLEMSSRAMHTAVRMTLNKANDDPMMQTHDFDGMNSEGRKAAEFVQSFGFTTVPLPRDEKEAVQAVSKIASSVIGAVGGAIGGGASGVMSAVNSVIGMIEQPKGPAAEGIALFLGAQRNHPVVIAVDDRRHRPMGLKPGENAQYDDIGQMTLIRRIGTFMLSLDSKDEKTGKTVERMASLRHVEKQKQKRPSIQQAVDSGPNKPETRDGATGGTQSKDFKHEGETVNTEVRCTKNRIEFRAGDNVVGYYDVSADTWFLTGKIVTLKSTQRVETVGKTYLGLDNAGEAGPLVATVSAPAKQTFAKV